MNEEQIKQLLKEARYMGSMDFANWILNHDESSWRSDRSWFKVKPKILTEYQAELLKNLERVRTNTGLDPQSTVRQLQSLQAQEDKGEK